MDPTSSPDELLYRRIKRGDLSAFEFLYERHKFGLFRFIRSYLKNQEEAEEVFHETFIQVLSSKEVDFSTGSFQGWLFLISRNICLNRIRSHRRGDHAIAELAVFETTLSTSVASAEQIMIDQHTRERVRASIGELPDALAQVLNLKLSGLAHKEIAQVLNIPVGTVKSRFHSLVEILKIRSGLYE